MNDTPGIYNFPVGIVYDSTKQGQNQYIPVTAKQTQNIQQQFYNSVYWLTSCSVEFNFKDYVVATSGSTGAGAYFALGGAAYINGSPYYYYASDSWSWDYGATYSESIDNFGNIASTHITCPPSTMELPNNQSWTLNNNNPVNLTVPILCGNAYKYFTYTGP
jgi:hypothetical protein